MKPNLNRTVSTISKSILTILILKLISENRVSSITFSVIEDQVPHDKYRDLNVILPDPIEIVATFSPYRISWTA